MLRILSIHAAAAAMALVSACSSLPADPYDASTMPVGHDDQVASQTRDLRARFRQATCKRLSSEADACDDVLLRLAGESDAPTSIQTSGDLTQQFRIAFVPGFLSECFEGFARPFADTERAFRRRGFVVDFMQVSGRGTTAANANRLAGHFASLPDDPRPLIVFAYSKGMPDMLEFLVRHPDAAQRVAAIVSVAGAVNGSPLAGKLNSPYRHWVAPFPLPGCDVGTGAELDDLRPERRLAWWQANGGLVTTPIFTLVASPRPSNVSAATMSTYRWLARIDPRNDGKLLWHDQIVPGSFQLGYVNADHWAIAIPMKEELTALATLFKDQVPRVALYEAAVEVIADTLKGGRDR